MAKVFIYNTRYKQKKEEVKKAQETEAEAQEEELKKAQEEEATKAQEEELKKAQETEAETVAAVKEDSEQDPEKVETIKKRGRKPASGSKKKAKFTKIQKKANSLKIQKKPQRKSKAKKVKKQLEAAIEEEVTKPPRPLINMENRAPAEMNSKIIFDIKLTQKYLNMASSDNGA